MIVSPKSAVPRVDVTVDLLSRAQRPYLFRAVATGQPPHSYMRSYEIRAESDDSAAMKAIELFVAEFGPQAIVREMETLAPKAVRQ